MMKFIFWVSFFILFYTYIGYAALLYVVSFIKRNKVITDETYAPSISFIIAAYNEQVSIKDKIEKTLALDYPKEKMEIIIASDASTDKTDEIVLQYAKQGVKLCRMDERRGKTQVQNLAVSKAKGEILVFSDATTIYKKDAIKKLVRNFADKKIAIVAGEEEFIKKGIMYKQVSVTWNYEKFLRRLESRFNSLIGVSGCIFAIRKNLYEKLSSGLIEDFTLPLLVLEKGYKVHLEEGAIGYEEPVSRSQDEFKRKARIVSNGISVVMNMRRLLNPFRNFKIAFQLISHKVFRWLAPIFMILLFVSSISLMNTGVVFFVFAIAQATFYLSAIFGYGLIRHFCIVNFAGIIGIFQFLRGNRKVM